MQIWILDLFIISQLIFIQDYVGNKRLELSGQLISLLFEVICLGYKFMLIDLVDGLLTSSFVGFIQINEFLCSRAFEQSM